MNIQELINKEAEKYSPYMNSFVNHLPMGQFALYNLVGDIESVEKYTEYYLKESNLTKVKRDYKKANSIEDCLGQRELYESCLDLIRDMAKESHIEELVSSILNKYTLGLSSGLFHTTIRLAYAIEGYKLDKELKSEVERALSYYITAYREDKLFERKISKDSALEEMNTLMMDPKMKEIRDSGLSRNKKLETLHNNKEFLKQGFIIEGSEADKVKGLLQILIPAFYNSNNIVMLHTITGLQGVVTLKDYFMDYKKALDILTTSAISHLLAQEDLDIDIVDTKMNKDWKEIIELVQGSKNVHTIKFAYSSIKLDNIFNVPDLKYATYRRAIID